MERKEKQNKKQTPVSSPRFSHDTWNQINTKVEQGSCSGMECLLAVQENTVIPAGAECAGGRLMTLAATGHFFRRTQRPPGKFSPPTFPLSSAGKKKKAKSGLSEVWRWGLRPSLLQPIKWLLATFPPSLSLPFYHPLQIFILLAECTLKRLEALRPDRTTCKPNQSRSPLSSQPPASQRLFKSPRLSRGEARWS